MNKELLEKLIHWKRWYLTRTELALLVDRSVDACDAIIRRAVKEGYLKRLRRGLYMITSKISAAQPDAREIAQQLYGPSYISFESALSWHGWIPEGVTVLTSASVKQRKEFETPIGAFSYEPVPSGAFHLDLQQVRTENGAFLMAGPWKALADLIYLRQKEWPDLEHISQDLRIEREDLLESNLDGLKDLSEHYPNGRTRRQLKRYYRELDNDSRSHP